LPGRYQLLRTGNWIPLDRLFAVGHDSAEYNTKSHAGMFYSQSWALAHMLYLSPNLGGKFSAFEAEIRKGTATATAVQEVYGMSPAELEKALRDYITGDSFYAGLFDIKMQK